jgi:hypothetical protein
VTKKPLRTKSAAKKLSRKLSRKFLFLIRKFRTRYARVLFVIRIVSKVIFITGVIIFILLLILGIIDMSIGAPLFSFAAGLITVIFGVSAVYVIRNAYIAGHTPHHEVLAYLYTLLSGYLILRGLPKVAQIAQDTTCQLIVNQEIQSNGLEREWSDVIAGRASWDVLEPYIPKDLALPQCSLLHYFEYASNPQARVIFVALLIPILAVFCHAGRSILKLNELEHGINSDIDGFTIIGNNETFWDKLTKDDIFKKWESRARFLVGAGFIIYEKEIVCLITWREDFFDISLSFSQAVLLVGGVLLLLYCCLMLYWFMMTWHLWRICLATAKTTRGDIIVWVIQELSNEVFNTSLRRRSEDLQTQGLKFNVKRSLSLTVTGLIMAALVIATGIILQWPGGSTTLTGLSIFAGFVLIVVVPLIRDLVNDAYKCIIFYERENNMLKNTPKPRNSASKTRSPIPSEFLIG